MDLDEPREHWCDSFGGSLISCLVSRARAANIASLGSFIMPFAPAVLGAVGDVAELARGHSLPMALFQQRSCLVSGPGSLKVTFLADVGDQVPMLRCPA